ncbi:hypothetical protein P3342_001773 [Pyrenophora teres f. teres]|nr:hypothetical protein P3342_001773 [Pyrenophora teres f. teres]
MNHIRITRSIWSRRAIPTRLATEPKFIFSSTTQGTIARSAYYGTFGSPILKCFLGALFTYQLTYYLWYKLETIEETHNTKAEIRDLQEELRQAIEKQRYMAQQKWGQATEAMEREREELEQAIDAVVGEVKEGVDGVGKGTRVASRVARGGWWPW